MFLFTVGIGLLLSCISVFLRDMFYIYGIIITMWNYLTPVFYSIEILPETLQSIFKLNPLFQFLDAARSIVLYGKAPSLATLAILGAIGLVTLGLGAFVFKKKQGPHKSNYPFNLTNIQYMYYNTKAPVMNH